MKKKIKVAMVAPAYGQTGGPEIATNHLAEALVAKGINVTLFAPADWKTKAKHIPTLEKSLWNMRDFKLMTAREMVNHVIFSQLKVLEYTHKFDIIHLHSHVYSYVIGKMATKPVVLTLHNRINKREFKQIKKIGVKVVALTKIQAAELKLKTVINNGIPVNDIVPSFKKGKYLITIGRLADQKGIDTAIKIAKRTDKKLLIFGRRGFSEKRREYFNKKLKPFIDNKQIIYKKEVPNNKIYDYLKNAEALLFPIRRPEAFGLVAIEALSCGTPVIGTKIDPLPEFLRDKEVVFLSNNINELIKAVKNIERFDRDKCRKYAEKNFDISIIADKYISFYSKILKKI